MRYAYDNSPANPRNPNHPPKRVLGGNQSTDEMGHLWLQVLPRGKDDQRDVLQEAIMRHRLDKYPADFSAHFNLGALLLARNQPDAAIPLLRDALNVEPDQPAALTALGAALVATQHPAEGQQQFEHALRVQPAYTNARYNLAGLQASDGHLQVASENFRQVMRENPDDAAAREHLFDILSNMVNPFVADGKLIEAIATLHEALSIHPESADAHNNLGVLLARQGDRASAIKEFEAALRTDPAHREASRNLDFARRQSP